VRGFIEFLKQYGVLALAIAVIIGGKLNAVVTALVDGILMPVIAFFVPGGGWRTAAVQLGPIRLMFGPFVAATIDFLVVALLIYWLYTKVLRQAPPAKG
jgi:large conductance mechanosensitive channel